MVDNNPDDKRTDPPSRMEFIALEQKLGERIEGVEADSAVGQLDLHEKMLSMAPEEAQEYAPPGTTRLEAEGSPRLPLTDTEIASITPTASGGLVIRGRRKQTFMGSTTKLEDFDGTEAMPGATWTDLSEAQDESDMAWVMSGVGVPGEMSNPDRFAALIWNPEAEEGAGAYQWIEASGVPDNQGPTTNYRTLMVDRYNRISWARSANVLPPITGSTFGHVFWNQTLQSWEVSNAGTKSSAYYDVMDSRGRWVNCPTTVEQIINFNPSDGQLLQFLDGQWRPYTPVYTEVLKWLNGPSEVPTEYGVTIPPDINPFQIPCMDLEYIEATIGGDPAVYRYKGNVKTINEILLSAEIPDNSTAYPKYLRLVKDAEGVVTLEYDDIEDGDRTGHDGTEAAGVALFTKASEGKRLFSKTVTDKRLTTMLKGIPTDIAPATAGDVLVSGGADAAPTFVTPAHAVGDAHGTAHVGGGTDAIPVATATAAGLLRALINDGSAYLRSDGNWATIPSDLPASHEVQHVLIDRGGVWSADYLKTNDVFFNAAGTESAPVLFMAGTVEDVDPEVSEDWQYRAQELTMEAILLAIAGVESTNVSTTFPRRLTLDVVGGEWVAKMEGLCEGTPNGNALAFWDVPTGNTHEQRLKATAAPAANKKSVFIFDGTTHAWVEAPTGSKSVLTVDAAGVMSFSTSGLLPPGAWDNIQVLMYHTQTGWTAVTPAKATVNFWLTGTSVGTNPGNGKVLTMVSGDPAWADPASGVPDASGASTYQVLQKKADGSVGWDYVRAT